MVSKDFDQAGALIKRLMEGVGGSANAYEEPIPEVGPVDEEPEPRPEPVNEDRSPSGVFDDDDICVNGEAELPEDRSWWCNPPPITDEYEAIGVVEEHGELKQIYEAIFQAVETGEAQEAVLETGKYVTESSFGDTWTIKDTVKDRLYCQEHAHGTYSDVVDEDDVFIWVMQASDHDVDLGYIHQGYVFLHK